MTEIEAVLRRKIVLAGGRRRETALPAEEFLRRFLLHVLPPGFVRIRSYGLLAHRCRRREIIRCRRLLATEPPPGPTAEHTEIADPPATPEPGACPGCQQGRLQPVAELPALRPQRARPAARSPP